MSAGDRMNLPQKLICRAQAVTAFASGRGRAGYPTLSPIPGPGFRVQKFAGYVTLIDAASAIAFGFSRRRSFSIWWIPNKCEGGFYAKVHDDIHGDGYPARRNGH